MSAISRYLNTGIGIYFSSRKWNAATSALASAWSMGRTVSFFILYSVRGVATQTVEIHGDPTNNHILDASPIQASDDAQHVIQGVHSTPDYHAAVKGATLPGSLQSTRVPASSGPATPTLIAGVSASRYLCAHAAKAGRSPRRANGGRRADISCAARCSGHVTCTGKATGRWGRRCSAATLASSPALSGARGGGSAGGSAGGPGERELVAL